MDSSEEEFEKMLEDSDDGHVRGRRSSGRATKSTTKKVIFVSCFFLLRK